MALSLYPILFLVSLPVADLLMINGHPQQSCPILGVRQICAGFGSRLHLPRILSFMRFMRDSQSVIMPSMMEKSGVFEKGLC